MEPMDIDFEGVKAKTFSIVQELANVNGKVVRHTTDPETGRPMTHVYEFLAAVGMKEGTIRTHMKTLKDASNELVRKMNKLKFDPIPGARQNHASWAADGETLYKLAMSLKPRYSRVFTEFAAKCASLAVGGSGALRSAVQEMEGVQAALPDTHPLRTFGREAEYQDRQFVRPVEQSMADPKYIHDRLQSVDFFHLLKTAVKKNKIEGDSAFWAQLHGCVSSSVLGMWPGAFAKEHDIKGASSSRDYMTTAQICVIAGLQATLLDMVPDYKNTDGYAFLKEVDNFTQNAHKTYQYLHGKYQEPTNLKDVRQMSTSSAPRIQNNTCTYMTINNY